MFGVVKQYSAGSVQFRALEKVCFINYRKLISVQVFISKLSLLLCKAYTLTNAVVTFYTTCVYIFSDFR